jgi:hypothetical protein
MTKGEEIRFQRGTYLGKTGWIDNDGTKLDTMVWVYVDNWKGDGRMKHTKVKKSSLAKKHLVPSSYAEAVMQQNPDIEAKLDKLCRDLAMCSIHKDPNGIIELVRQGLQKASVEQDELGYKKKFRKVVFGSTKKHSA